MPLKQQESQTEKGYNVWLESNITRGELAVWIYKAFDLEPGNGKMPFKDVEGQYVEAVSALVNNDITHGTTPTTFGIKDTAKQGDFAIFLYKAAQAAEAK